MNEETQIRPYKWSAWDFEIYSRDRNGKTEYAFITLEHKWVDLDIEGDYVLVPLEQHKLLAPMFKEMTDSNIRAQIYEEQAHLVEQDMAPFGFIENGVNNMSSFVDDDGDRWFLDEYGDMSYMWDYK